MKCSEEANPQRQKADEYVRGAGGGGRTVIARWVGVSVWDVMESFGARQC